MNATTTNVYVLTDVDMAVLKASWQASDSHLKIAGRLTARIREVCDTSAKLDLYKAALIEATDASTDDKEKKAARKATIRATVSRFENMKRKLEGEAKWPRKRAEGAGRKKSDSDGEEGDAPTPARQIAAAVSVIVKHYKELSKPDLAAALAPLIPVHQHANSKK